MRLKVLILAAGVFAAGCSPAPAPAPQAFPTDGPQQVKVGVADGMPQWLAVAYQRGRGQAFWDRNSIVRYPGQEATIWAQVRYGTPEVFEGETATTRQIIRYEIARMHYRFKCAEGTFAITEHRFIGNDDAVLGSEVFDPPVYRDVLPNTMAAVLQPIACLARSTG